MRDLSYLIGAMLAACVLTVVCYAAGSWPMVFGAGSGVVIGGALVAGATCKGAR